MTLPGLVPQPVAPRPETGEATAPKVARQSLEALALKAGQVLDAKVLQTAANGLTQLAIAGQTLSVQLTLPMPAGTLLRLLVQPGGANGLPVLVTQPQATAPSATVPPPLPQTPPALPLPQAATPQAAGAAPSPAQAPGASPAPQAQAPAPSPAAASPPGPAPTAASPQVAVATAAPAAAHTPAPAPSSSPVAQPGPVAALTAAAPPQGPANAANPPPTLPVVQPAATPVALAPVTADPAAPPASAAPQALAGPVAQAAPASAGLQLPLPGGGASTAPLPGNNPPLQPVPLAAVPAPPIPAAAMPATTPAAVAQPGPLPTQPQQTPGAIPVSQPPGSVVPSAGPNISPAPAATPAVTSAPTPPGPPPAAQQVPAAALPPRPAAPPPAALPPRPGSAAEAMLGQATQAAARQDSVLPLLANLASLSGRMAELPRPVAEAALRLLGARIGLDRGAPDAETLKQAVLRSGIFLEALSRPGATQAPQPGDAKAALMALRHALEAWLGPELAPVAPVTRRPPPPTRGAQPRGLAGDLPTLPEATSAREAGRTLQGQAEAALSRLRLLQLSSLPQDAARAALGPAGAAEWNLELPMLLGHELALMGLQIQRDGGRGRGDKRERGWRLAFSLNFSALGEVGAQVALYGRSTSVTIWAEEAETAAALEQMLPELAPALIAKGLSVGSVRVRRGRPVPVQPQAGRLMDSLR